MRLSGHAIVEALSYPVAQAGTMKRIAPRVDPIVATSVAAADGDPLAAHTPTPNAPWRAMDFSGLPDGKMRAESIGCLRMPSDSPAPLR